MRAAKSRTWTTAAAAVVFAVVATAWPAAASPWPPADVAGVEPASPLLAAVTVELEPTPITSPPSAIATAPDVELALEAPRSWTHLEELERLSESVLWGLEASASGAANPCETGPLRLKTRVRGYQLFGGGNGAVSRPLRPVIPTGFGASCTAEASGGVFVTIDPLGYVGGPNLYQYGLNNPVNFSDPMGLESAEIMQRHRMAYETGTNPYYMQTAAEGAVVVAEEMAPYLANPYVQGSLQVAGGCTEAFLGGAAVLSGGGAVPGAIALAHGTDMCGTGFTTLLTGQTQDTLFNQGVRGGLVYAGVDEQYANYVAVGLDLGVGIGAPLAAGRALSAARATTAARAETAIISRVGRGQGGHQVVDRIAAEAQGSLSQANRMLQGGGTGGTRWGSVYQRVSGRGSWFENMSRRNALHSIAERQMLSNRYVLEALDQGFVVQFNRGSLLGARSSRGALLRPDIQIRVPQGRFGIVDWTTEGSARKIFKYGDPVSTPWMLNVTVP